MVIVGPCASGKSTLAGALRDLGYDAFSIAQEHSSIRRMHARHRPDYLVYLEVGYEEILRRRGVSWGPRHLEIERRRLSWAREEADIIVHTDGKDPSAVLEEILASIEGGASN